MAGSGKSASPSRKATTVLRSASAGYRGKEGVAQNSAKLLQVGTASRAVEHLPVR